jgi:glycosyltransferase involved in cell wall biosynthesis
MNPKVSVVMASYNHAAFVREAVESVRTQSFTDFELVITDDGSRDATVEVIRGISDSRILLRVFPENRGACAAMNDAISRARGEYVAVLNSDDYFLPGKLERQVRFLDEHPELGAVFGLPVFVDERGTPFRNPRHAWNQIFVSENRTRLEWLRYFFYHGNGLCHPTIMLHRSCYEKVGRFDPLLMQVPDLDLWVRLCKQYEIHVLPERITAFRILDRERNTSAPTKERLARSAWETCAVLGHYATLPEAELRAILAQSPGASARVPARRILAVEALKIGKPGYAPFGLGLLRDGIRQDDGFFPGTDYFRLIGEHDPFGAEFFGREFQHLRKSRTLRLARSLARWWRSRNFHERA